MIKKLLEKNLEEKRYEHTLGVADTAACLAMRYGYDVDKLINNKKKNSIVWAGRLIDWKHPEYAIEAAKQLKAEAYEFELNIREKIGIYLATDLTPGEQHLDEDEFVTYEEHSLEELCEKIYSGEITDGKTVCAILTYKSKFVNLIIVIYRDISRIFFFISLPLI